MFHTFRGRETMCYGCGGPKIIFLVGKYVALRCASRAGSRARQRWSSFVRRSVFSSQCLLPSVLFESVPRTLWIVWVSARWRFLTQIQKTTAICSAMELGGWTRRERERGENPGCQQLQAARAPSELSSHISLLHASEAKKQVTRSFTPESTASQLLSFPRPTVIHPWSLFLRTRGPRTCFRSLGTLWGGRGIVLDGRFGASPSPSFVFRLRWLSCTSKGKSGQVDSLVDNRGSNGEHVCSGKQRTQCVELTDDYGLHCHVVQLKPAHLVRVTQMHMFLVSCTHSSRAGHIHARALARGHVDCLNTHAHQRSLVRLMFRGTLFDAPGPFPSFRSTPPPTQSSLLHTGMSMKTLCHSARRSSLWPNGRTEPSYRKPAARSPCRQSAFWGLDCMDRMF